MLILENLRKVNNNVFADFYFPGSEARGKVAFDAQKKAVVEIDCGERDAESIYGIRHLTNVLRMMADNNKYPERFEYYWY